jgi:hypothetical protein
MNNNNNNLTTEIQRMWNVKTNMIPEIRGATGTISKSFRKYLSNVSGKHEIKKKLQETAILGTALTWQTSESTNVKYKIFSIGNNITCTISCNYSTLLLCMP